jgi:hypothetical protein
VRILPTSRDKRDEKVTEDKNCNINSLGALFEKLETTVSGV